MVLSDDEGFLCRDLPTVEDLCLIYWGAFLIGKPYIKPFDIFTNQEPSLMMKHSFRGFRHCYRFQNRTIKVFCFLYGLSLMGKRTALKVYVKL